MPSGAGPGDFAVLGFVGRNEADADGGPAVTSRIEPNVFHATPEMTAAATIPAATHPRAMSRCRGFPAFLNFSFIVLVG